QAKRFRGGTVGEEMRSRPTRKAIGLLAAVAVACGSALAPPAAPAAGAAGGVCSPTGPDGCPAGGVGRPQLSVRAEGASASALAAPTPEAAVGVGPETFTGYGFDACSAPSSRSMRAWRESSSFEAVGVYIGGRNRGCSQPNLTATWVG